MLVFISSFPFWCFKWKLIISVYGIILNNFFYCNGFCHTLKWNSHGFTCVPHPDPPSHLPLHPITKDLKWPCLKCLFAKGSKRTFRAGDPTLTAITSLCRYRWSTSKVGLGLFSPFTITNSIVVNNLLHSPSCRTVNDTWRGIAGFVHPEF